MTHGSDSGGPPRKNRIRRRTLLKAGAALPPALAGASAAFPAVAAAPSPGPWPPPQPPRAPKICLGISPNADRGLMRKYRQIGVEHVLMGGSPIPWRENDLRARMDQLRAGGLTLVNLMIAGFPDILYGRPGRDREIDQVCESIQAAGKVGLPVVEYNFYAHRLTEGHFEEEGRGGAGLTASDYARSRMLPPLPEIGVHTAEEMWSNLTYFLQRVVPVAERCGVRLALHPNDPPVPASRGPAQIMSTLDHWKRLIEIVPSPANGITYDCGVTREIGEDPVEVCRYFGSRDRINHVHYRNVRVRVASLDYTEVFPDEGEVDMLAVMRELVRLQYPRAIYPEHPRALDADRELPGFNPYDPGGGGYSGLVYNVAYTRAMLQAALALAAQ